MSKQILAIFAIVVLLASCYQSADAATLISSGDCAGNREYNDLALNQTKKTTKTSKTTRTSKTSKTTARAQTQKVELPSSWERGIMMGGRYEYCFTSMEIGSASMDISLFKNGISLTVSFSKPSSGADIPASAKLTVGEDAFVVKSSDFGDYDEYISEVEYTLNVTDTATVNKIISSIATGNCIIKFDNGQQCIEFPATGEFAKDINKAYKWVRSNPDGYEI